MAHLFYQYHPYSNEWGPMHWGHVKSRDLIRWERLPAALAPDCGYDAAGCFSGGAVEMPGHIMFPPQSLQMIFQIPIIFRICKFTYDVCRI